MRIENVQGSKVPSGWMNCPLFASRHAVVSKTTPYIIIIL